MTDHPAIAVVPYGKWPNFGIAELSLNELEWPLGRPDRLADGTIRDMAATDHLVTFPRGAVFYLPWFGVKAKVSVMILEPELVHRKHFTNARIMGWRFWRVLTKSRNLIERIGNGIFFPFGSSFIGTPEDIDRTKTKLCSLIASSKIEMEGHRLRHDIVQHVRNQNLDVEVMGRGYKSFLEKEDGLAPYRYSVVIENIREEGYFTEKIVDACLCETVPIYWGAPDIGDFFDPGGMIICESANDVRAALSTLSAEDYESRLPAIRSNRTKALFWAKLYLRAANAIEASLASSAQGPAVRQESGS